MKCRNTVEDAEKKIQKPADNASVRTKNKFKPTKLELTIIIGTLATAAITFWDGTLLLVAVLQRKFG